MELLDDLGIAWHNTTPCPVFPMNYLRKRYARRHSDGVLRPRVGLLPSARKEIMMLGVAHANSALSLFEHRGSPRSSTLLCCQEIYGGGCLLWTCLLPGARALEVVPVGRLCKVCFRYMLWFTDALATRPVSSPALFGDCARIRPAECTITDHVTILPTFLVVSLACKNPSSAPLAFVNVSVLRSASQDGQHSSTVLLV